LKEWIETGQVLSKTEIRGIEPVGPLRMVGVRMKCSMTEIGSAIGSAFHQTTQTIDRYGVPSDGEPIAVYHAMDMKGQTFDFTAGLVVPESVDSMPEDLASVSIPATPALVVEHLGSYDNLGNAWSAAYQFVRYKKLKPTKVPAFEVYRNDPDQTPSSNLRTEISVPLK
ncbi:MAG: GyrI-like domain-containing protein, partial [Planctomycetes bacterium]|nr:GyrI-like domain-containing protein [Planctomycetota bacterium]